MNTPNSASSIGRDLPKSQGVTISIGSVPCIASRFPSTADDACKLAVHTTALGAGGIHTSCLSSAVLHLALSRCNAA